MPLRSDSSTTKYHEGLAVGFPSWYLVFSVVEGSRIAQATAYCGLLPSLGGGVDTGAGVELEAGAGSAVAGEVCDVAGVA